MPAQTQSSVLNRASSVALKRRQLLKGPMVQRTHVYFPETGAITTEAGAGAGRSRLGIGLVGRRGFIGLTAVLDVPSSPLVAVVVDPGEAIALPVHAMHELMRTDHAFAQQMNRYLHSRLVLLAQINFCNATHSVEQRLARWLLVGSHQVDSDELCLTHQEIAGLLGVRRPSVSTALEQLTKDGGIGLNRRSVRLIDSGVLQKRACACYRHMIAESEKGIAPLYQRKCSEAI